MLIRKNVVFLRKNPIMDKYTLIESEIAQHPEIQQWTKEELRLKESDFGFWDDLSEHINCLKTCNICHRPMIEGYCIDGRRAYYCSDECLHHNYTTEEFDEMYDDGNGSSYWTVWGE